MRRAAALALLATWLLAARAAGAQALVLGAGGSTCGAMLESIAAYGERQEVVYQSWVQGYLSALNVRDLAPDPGAELHDLVGWAEQWQKLKGACRDHPESSVVAALVALWRELPALTFEALAPATRPGSGD